MDKEMMAAIRQQVLVLRNSGATNMFDISTVRYLAEELGLEELGEFIDRDVNEYGHLILTGHFREEEE